MRILTLTFAVPDDVGIGMAYAGAVAACTAIRQAYEEKPGGGETIGVGFTIHIGQPQKEVK